MLQDAIVILIVALGSFGSGFYFARLTHKCKIELQKVTIGHETLEVGQPYHLPKDCKVIAGDGQVAYEGNDLAEAKIIRQSMIDQGFPVVLFLNGKDRG